MNYRPLVAALALAAAPLPAVAADRPNFVVLVADDQRADAMSCANNPVLATPNMDRIAADGVRFRNAFVTNSLSAPGRASLLTGLYSHAHGVIDDAGRRVPEAVPLVSDRLRKAGYEVAFCGKPFLDGALRDRKWDYYFGTRTPGSALNPVAAEGADGKDRSHPGYADDVFTDHAVRWLKKKHDKPFCLFLFFHGAQRPWDRAPRHKDLFADVTVQKPYLWGADRSLKSKAFVQADNHVGDFTDVRDYETFVKDYYATLTAVDENVGKVLDALKEAGELDETAVFYTSDNGYLAGEWQAFEKRFMYDPSIRVPLLVRYPKLGRRNMVSGQTVLNIDLAPTLLELAGQPVPKELHGRSLVPLLAGRATAWREDWLYEYYESPKPHNVRPHRGVRSDRYKYIHYFTEPQEFELYDLFTDENETRNLAGRASSADVMKRMAARLEELRRETRDLPAK